MNDPDAGDPQAMTGPRFTHVAAAGWRAVAALDTTGTLWVCGALPGLAPSSTFTKVLDDITTVAAGANNIAAVDRSGSVLVAGANGTSQHGDGSGADTDLAPDGFHRVPGLDSIRSVAAGDGHVVAVDHDHRLWGWGANTDGQLDTEDLVDLVWPTYLRDGVTSVAAAHHHTLIVDDDSTLSVLGTTVTGVRRNDPTSRPEQLSCTITDVAAATTSDGSALVIAGNGDLYGTGVNDFGQLGDTGGPRDDVTRLAFPARAVTAAISDHSAVIDDTGALWVTGANGAGQLGLGNHEDRYGPLAGRSTFTRVANAPTAIAVTATGVGTHLVAADGTLWFAGAEHSGVGLAGTNTFTRIDVGSTRTRVAAELSSRAMTVSGAYQLADLALHG